MIKEAIECVKVTKEAIECVKLLVTMVNKLSESRGLDEMISAHLNASRNILNEIEKNKSDDKFILNAYVRLLTNLELIYFTTKDTANNDFVNNICFHIALSHRVLNSPEDVIRKWAIVNRKKGDHYTGFSFIEDWHYIKYVLGDCYDDYHKQCRKEREEKAYKSEPQEWDLLDIYR